MILEKSNGMDTSSDATATKSEIQGIQKLVTICF